MPSTDLHTHSLSLLQYYEMSYGLNVEMHKQVNITTPYPPFWNRCCKVSSSSPLPTVATTLSHHGKLTREPTFLYILFPSLFGDESSPYVPSPRGPASVNVACLPESLRGISLSHVRGRINICHTRARAFTILDHHFERRRRFARSIDRRNL